MSTIAGFGFRTIASEWSESLIKIQILVPHFRLLGVRLWNLQFIKFSTCSYTQKDLKILGAEHSYAVAKSVGLMHLEAI